jgi:hypothetical protein
MILRWARQIACFGDARNSYIITARKPEGERSFAKLRKSWYNITPKMNGCIYFGQNSIHGIKSIELYTRRGISWPTKDSVAWG